MTTLTGYKKPYTGPKAKDTTARDLGTLLHKQIEYRLQGKEVENPLDELDRFDAFERAHKHWDIIENEKTVYTDKHEVAGTFDALYEDNRNGERILIDWKRIYKLYDESREKFTWQLNGYQYMINEDESMDRHEVDKRMLILMHPKVPGFRSFNIEAMEPTEIEELMALGKVAREVLKAREKAQAQAAVALWA